MRDIDLALARLVETGQVCVECQSEFVRPHGFRVLCGYCFRRSTPNEREGAKLATHQESDAAYHAARAREQCSRLR